MDDDNFPGGILGLLIAGLLLFTGYCIFGNWMCKSRWERSDMAVEWGPIQGCMVKTPSGRWLPTDNLRDVDLAPAPKASQPDATIPK